MRSVRGDGVTGEGWSTTARVATWNLQAIRGAAPQKLAGIVRRLTSQEVDIACLQEVSTSTKTVGALRDELVTAGLTEVHFAGRDEVPLGEDREKRYGNIVASRWPLTPVSVAEARWPQLLAIADVASDQGPVRVMSAHIPNGSGNGWEKVFAFESLLVELTRLPLPVVLAGDFNEPRSFQPAFHSFGAKAWNGRVDGQFTDLFSVTHDRIRWQSAVEGVLSPSPTANAWGGRHIATQIGAEIEPTHIARGTPKQFDHIMTGPGLRGIAVEYDHSVREHKPRLSDHSLVVAAICRDLRGSVGS